MRKIQLKNNMSLLLCSLDEFAHSQDDITPESILFCDKVDNTEIVITIIDDEANKSNEEDIFGEPL